MEYLVIPAIAALVFGVCYLLDKGFSKIFRNKAEHAAGKSVRLSSRSAAFGLIAGAIGVAAILTGLSSGWMFFVGGGLLLLIGVVLVVQYVTFGIFYAQDSFVYTTFGKRSVTYCYKDIMAQQLFNSHGNIIIELHMADGQTVMLQSGMKEVYPFLDHAFAAWLRQTGRTKESCAFYDPAKSCWFPPVEE